MFKAFKKKKDLDVVPKEDNLTEQPATTPAINNDKPEKKKGRFEHYRALQCFAYFAMILIAIAMILRLIFKNSQTPAVEQYVRGIGECMAYIVCIWLGFYWTMKRKNIWWLVGWIVASVILVIFYIFAVV